MPLVDEDLLPLLLASAEGKLPDTAVSLSGHVSVGIVLASAGYPGPIRSGAAIGGLDEADAVEDVTVFHSGTALVDGRVVTAGGRVLTVVAAASDFGTAIARAYAAAGRITFDGMQYRRDIGAKALAAAPVAKP
jgi:phosphoribosylamine--glycine ligase